MALVLSLTNAGLAAVQGASGSDPVVIAELGLSATPFTAAPTLVALPGEFKRIAAVAGTAAAPNVTHMSAYDTSADVWNATGLGLWLADGTLFAVYSAPTTIVNKAGPAFALIAFDIAWSGDLAGSIAFGDPIFTNPPATEEMRGLIEIADEDEALDGTDLVRALTPGRAKDVILPWLLDQDGNDSGLDADLWRGKTPSEFLADFLADSFAAGSNANGNWRKEPDGAGGFFIRQWGIATTGYGFGAGNDGWSGSFDLPIAFTDMASVQGRAWPKTMNVTGVDSSAVVAELLTASTYRVGSEDIVRDVYWEFFGK
ncbi:hypothetical protein [Novosphingobium sp.]|uniref:hypothetical protein n=1 Tax=Novosphingobium sp. TaxID=1874826 RepID=UPI002613763C|nr:hypothetical protein [Novosphingobium sp.]